MAIVKDKDGNLWDEFGRKIEVEFVDCTDWSKVTYSLTAKSINESKADWKVLRGSDDFKGFEISFHETI